MDEVIFIKKSELIKVIYCEGDVLENEEDRKFRRSKIKAATMEHGGKTNMVRIAFHSEKHGVLGVKSEIIGLTQNYCILRGGHNMPIRCIYKID